MKPRHETSPPPLRHPCNDLGRLNALAMAPSILTTGTRPEAMAEGQAVFAGGKRTKPRLR